MVDPCPNLMTPNCSDWSRGTLIPATVTPAPGIKVVVEHLYGIDPVDVVGPEHKDIVGLFVVDQVQVLEQGVG